MLFQLLIKTSGIYPIIWKGYNWASKAFSAMLLLASTAKMVNNDSSSKLTSSFFSFAPVIVCSELLFTYPILNWHFLYFLYCTDLIYFSFLQPRSLLSNKIIWYGITFFQFEGRCNYFCQRCKIRCTFYKVHFWEVFTSLKTFLKCTLPLSLPKIDAYIPKPTTWLSMGYSKQAT